MTQTTEPVFRKIIENDDGTFDIYEAGSLEGLVNKLAEAKRAAVAQTRLVLAEKRLLEAERDREHVEHVVELQASILRGGFQSRVN